MAFLIGAALALCTGLLAWQSGLSKDRAFYATTLIVIATYYVLFAALAERPEELIEESLIALGFALLAVLGFRRGLWIVAAGLALHGVFDLLHTSSAPRWWPAFCSAYDLVLAAILLGAERRRAKRERTPSRSGSTAHGNAGPREPAVQLQPP